MRQFVHERQRNPHDCVVCALAMFLKRPYDDIVRHMLSLCERTLITWTPDEPVPSSLMRLVGLEYRQTIVTMSEVPADSPAILTLASTNPHWLHVVYMSPEMVIYDPHHGVEPTDFNPSVHLYAEAHVRLRDLAPWVLREVGDATIAAWPEIELRVERYNRAAGNNPV